MFQVSSSHKSEPNNAKTNQWVEAKSRSYDGDERGYPDDYDKHELHDKPDPKLALVRGFRQRGLSANQTSGSVNHTNLANNPEMDERECSKERSISGHPLVRSSLSLENLNRHAGGASLETTKPKNIVMLSSKKDDDRHHAEPILKEGRSYTKGPKPILFNGAKISHVDPVDAERIDPQRANKIRRKFEGTTFRERIKRLASSARMSTSYLQVQCLAREISQTHLALLPSESFTSMIARAHWQGVFSIALLPDGFNQASGLLFYRQNIFQVHGFLPSFQNIRYILIGTSRRFQNLQMSTVTSPEGFFVKDFSERAIGRMATTVAAPKDQRSDKPPGCERILELLDDRSSSDGGSDIAGAKIALSDFSEESFSQSEDSDDTALTSPEHDVKVFIAFAKHRLIASLMQDIYIMFDSQWNARARGHTASQSEYTSTQAQQMDTADQSSTKEGKRRMQDRDSPPPDDNDGKRKKASPKGSSSEGKIGRPLLACPFHKNDPLKYRANHESGIDFRSCAGPGFQTISRLK